MPKTTKHVEPSVLIVDNKCGKVFIVEKSESNKSKTLYGSKVKIEKQKNPPIIQISEEIEFETEFKDEESECLFDISELNDLQ